MSFVLKIRDYKIINLIIKRLITAVMVMLGVTFMTYAMMMFVPGDAAFEVAIARYGGEGLVDKATIEWIRQQEGLDKSFLHKYFIWLTHAIHFDFGKSLIEEEPVSELILSRFKNTIQLSIFGILIAVLIAFPIGILTGIKHGTWIDSMGISAGVIGVSVPNYWLGLLLIIIFSVKLQWFPSYGRGDWHNIILPAVTLGTGLTAYTARILRSAIIETLKGEYLLALKAKGLGSPVILGRHIFKNALIPVITVIGLEFGMIMEGAVITETIFAWPGIGMLMVDAVSNRDYPLIQGLVLFTGAIFVFINFIVDILYLYLDPRIRLS